VSLIGSIGLSFIFRLS
jgi:hypothetical protein